MDIREYKTYDETEILGLYASVGWTAYTEQPESLRRALKRRFWYWRRMRTARLSVLSALWATGRRLYSCRTFWCTRPVSAAESERRF